MTAPLMPSYPLLDGGHIPCFGLGTFRAEGNDCYESCLASLRLGYRLLDTAALYENEDQVGAAIAQFLSEQSGVKRSDLCVVTKLHWDLHGGANAVEQLDASLKRLQLDYVDVFLIHSPKGGKILETYAALQEAKKQGKCRAVGVSNFGVDHLKGLIEGGLPTPSVNQIELHVWNQQRDTVAYCKAMGIVVMAYCPLARGQKFGKTALADYAVKLATSEAALCNYWVVMSGLVTIPKSTSAARLKSNLAELQELRLTAMDAAQLYALDEGYEASLAVQSMKLPWDSVK